MLRWVLEKDKQDIFPGLARKLGEVLSRPEKAKKPFREINEAELF